MNELNVSVKKFVEQRVMNSLLDALERLADEGSGADVIRVSKYLLRLSQKLGNVSVSVAARKVDNTDDP